MSLNHLRLLAHLQINSLLLFVGSCCPCVLNFYLFCPSADCIWSHSAIQTSEPNRWNQWVLFFNSKLFPSLFTSSSCVSEYYNIIKKGLVSNPRVMSSCHPFPPPLQARTLGCIQYCRAMMRIKKEEEEMAWCNLKTSYCPEKSATENKIIAAQLIWEENKLCG